MMGSGNVRLTHFGERKKGSFAMFTQALFFLHNLTTLLFGVFLSAFFLGIRQNGRNICTLFLFFHLEGILYVASFLLLGEPAAVRLYPLLVHLPLALFLSLYYKYSFASSCASVFSAYLCCQLSNWIGLAVLAATDRQWCYYLSRILITVLSFFLLCRFVCRTTETIFSKRGREFYVMAFPPFVYYVFDYVFTKFSNLLYSGSSVIVEFMGFIFCAAYFSFLFLYVREYESRMEIRQHNGLMEMQLLSIRSEAEHIKSSKHKLSILKHDMRHQLNIILTQLQNNNVQQAIDYIREINESYEDAAIIPYYPSEMVNSVISIYQARLTDKGIALKCDISMKNAPPGTDAAVCMILSNALENAMHALENADMAEKWVRLFMAQKEHHFLLQIENPILQAPKLVDGIPVSGSQGHGFGVKSILHYVRQLKGQCQFSASDSSFVLRIIV